MTGTMQGFIFVQLFCALLLIAAGDWPPALFWFIGMVQGFTVGITISNKEENMPINKGDQK